MSLIRPVYHAINANQDSTEVTQTTRAQVAPGLTWTLLPAKSVHQVHQLERLVIESVLRALLAFFPLPAKWVPLMLARTAAVHHANSVLKAHTRLPSEHQLAHHAKWESTALLMLRPRRQLV